MDCQLLELHLQCLLPELRGGRRGCRCSKGKRARERRRRDREGRSIVPIDNLFDKVQIDKGHLRDWRGLLQPGRDTADLLRGVTPGRGAGRRQLCFAIPSSQPGETVCEETHVDRGHCEPGRIYCDCHYADFELLLYRLEKSTAPFGESPRAPPCTWESVPGQAISTSSERAEKQSLLLSASHRACSTEGKLAWYHTVLHTHTTVFDGFCFLMGASRTRQRHTHHARTLWISRFHHAQHYYY